MKRIIGAFLRRRRRVAPASWPKPTPGLTPDQVRIRDDFMAHWLEVLPKQWGVIERINHLYALQPRPSGRTRTLEIGAGSGSHLAYEDLRLQEYTAMELRRELGAVIRRNHPDVNVLIGDVQDGIPVPDGSFDRVVAIHVLEHLPRLPEALSEIRRVLRPGGVLSAVIPCDGGLAYEVARTISSRRLFESRYGSPYDWCIDSEHVSTAWELLAEIPKHFTVERKTFWPLLLPMIDINLVIGLTCRR